MSTAAIPLEGGILRRLSDLFLRRPSFLLLLLLIPPLLWLGIVYLGALIALLMHSFSPIMPPAMRRVVGRHCSTSRS